MATKIYPATGRPGTLTVAWWRIRGWFRSRATCSYLAAEAERVRATAEADAERARAEAASVRVLYDSVLEVVKSRDAEILALKREKAEQTSTIAIREHEIKELRDWLERVRVRVNADIASEVAREQRNLHPTMRANAGQSSEQ